MTAQREVLLRRSDLTARVVVGLVLFCVIPGTIGAALFGWEGLMLALLLPAAALGLTLVVAFGLLTEWVFGSSPKQYMDRERGHD